MPKSHLWRAVPVLALLVFILLALAARQPAADQDDSMAAVRQLMSNNLRRGRPLQALYQARVLAAESGWIPDLLRTAGEIALALGDPALAADYWEAIPPEAVPYPLLRQLAGLYHDLQDWTRFAGTLDRLLAIAPEDTWAHYNLGWMFAVTQPDAALPHLQAVVHDPLYRDLASELLVVVQTTRVHLPMQIGLTLAERGLWAQAEYAFRQATSGDGPLAEALAYTALARDQQGKDGQPFIQQAAARAPQNALVRFLEGLHLRLVGDLAGSLASLQLAAALDPVNPAYAAELGSAYHLMDDVGQAESWFKHALTLSGGDPRFQERLDTFYGQTLPK